MRNLKPGTTSASGAPGVRCFLLLAVMLAVFGIEPASAAENSSITSLQQGWTIQSSAKVTASGQTISTAQFKPDGWYPATVPSTVLAALVADHVYPDPYYGANLRSIPGADYPVGANFANLPMPDDSPFKVPWWYRTEFQLPGSYKGKNLWLDFNGINYRANVWLNGVEIADQGKMAGMWRLFEFNVTATARPGETNTLAVEVFPPTPDSLSITWVDWNPMPPDKDMGVWREVYISTSGPMALRDSQVSSKLDLPSLDAAHLTVSARLVNPGTEPVKGVLKARLAGINVSQDVELGAGESKPFSFTPDKFPELNLRHPRIWWPAQMGTPNLYSLEIEVESGGKLSDAQSLQFGVREITSELDQDRHRLFSVNGKRILIRGGGWAPDMMLRYDPAREREEIDYTRDMGLNTIRLEGKLGDDHLFELADRYGILVMAGWCCCDHWERWRTWKDEDYDIAGESLRSQLLRLRSHASLLAFFYGSDNAPPKRVEDMYLQVIKETGWPNPYVASAAARSTEVGPSGVKMSGPYDYVAPSYWLEDTGHGGAFGFSTEISPGPAIPVIESVREMLPEDKLWPINEVWELHAGGGQFKRLDPFNRALEARYGPPTGLDDYVERSQLMTYAGERAMFEAYSQNKYKSTGVIQWMENNAWPSMIWHLYDWYLRPGGGYFGTKKACEPVHIQYSDSNNAVVVVNSTYQAVSSLKAKIEVLNLDMTSKFSHEATLDAAPDSSHTLLTLPKIDGLSTTYFLKLELGDSTGRVLSRNFYWLSTHSDVNDFANSTWYMTPLSSYADYKGLSTLPKVRVDLSATSNSHGGEEVSEVTLKNPSSSLAFFVHLEVHKGKNGGDVHPIEWQDNYVSLVPGESRKITATYSVSELGGANPVVTADGWNVEAASAE
ncbi:MAG TPA: glycoside hydrolase family 2 protein [Terriglobia bacterium]|nr:glycoside hydrolase family 2 protein [Terriglobia bacterium]